MRNEFPGNSMTDPASHLRLPLTMPSYSRHSSSSDQSESSLPISTNSSLDLERSVDGGMPPDRVSPTPSLLVSRSPEHSGQANSQRSTPNEEDDPSPLSEFAQEGSRNLSQSFYDPFKVKHRRRTSPAQLKTLEYHYERGSKPDVNLRKALAEQLDMTPREVQVWFQNRRAKMKKLRQQNEPSDALDRPTRSGYGGPGYSGPGYGGPGTAIHLAQPFQPADDTDIPPLPVLPPVNQGLLDTNYYPSDQIRIKEEDCSVAPESQGSYPEVTASRKPKYALPPHPASYRTQISPSGTRHSTSVYTGSMTEGMSDMSMSPSNELDPISGHEYMSPYASDIKPALPSYLGYVSSSAPSSGWHGRVSPSHEAGATFALPPAPFLGDYSRSTSVASTDTSERHYKAYSMDVSDASTPATYGSVPVASQHSGSFGSTYESRDYVGSNGTSSLPYRRTSMQHDVATEIEAQTMLSYDQIQQQPPPSYSTFTRRHSLGPAIEPYSTDSAMHTTFESLAVHSNAALGPPSSAFSPVPPFMTAAAFAAAPTAPSNPSRRGSTSSMLSTIVEMSAQIGASRSHATNGVRRVRSQREMASTNGPYAANVAVRRIPQAAPQSAIVTPSRSLDCVPAPLY